LLPFPGFHQQIGDFPVQFGFAHFFALGVAIVLLVSVAFWLRFSRLGVAVRAMAENGERAALLGINVGMLSSVVWAMAGLFSGAGVALTGLVMTPAAAEGFAPDVLLPALAAAVVGRMRSLWWTS